MREYKIAVMTLIDETSNENCIPSPDRSGILLFFSLKNKRYKWIAGNSS